MIGAMQIHASILCVCIANYHVYLKLFLDYITTISG